MIVNMKKKAFCSLPTGTLHEKKETKKLTKIPASYEQWFYKTLGNLFDKTSTLFFNATRKEIFLVKMLKIIFLQPAIYEKGCKMISIFMLLETN